MMTGMSLDLPATAWADEMRRALETRETTPAGWAPPMDVLEGDDRLEIRLDVAGVPRDAIRVSVRGGTLLIAGQKPHACRVGAAFHVAERACGRFARALPLALAFDASAIRATLTQGELRIVIPRIEERRGREIEIPVVSS
jgi:HSP20 family protein